MTTIYIQQSSNDIQESTTSSSGPWTTISAWPYNVSASTTISFTNDLTISTSTTGTASSGTDVYFDVTGNNVTFNGNFKTVNITGVTLYPGLIGGLSNRSGIVVNDIIISPATSTLATGGGWVCSSTSASFSGSSLTINSCSSNGPISNASGGICGNGSGTGGGILSINNCYSTGDMTDSGGGGILGNGSGDATNPGNVTVTGCYYTGTIDQPFAGGIIGSFCKVTCNQCYSTGDISEVSCGGIIGNNSTNCVVTNCYTSGNITASYCGGIVGGDTISGNLTISNSYTTGGLISSPNASAGMVSIGSSATVTFTNCYTLSASSYFGGGSSVTLTNTYNPTRDGSGTWSDTTAGTNLTGGPSAGAPKGTTWTGINTGTPWILSSLSYSPYSGYPNTSTSQTILQGQSTSAALTTSNYKIASINNLSPSTVPTITINSTSGVISTTSSTPVNSYSIQVVSGTSNPITSSNITSSSTFDLQVNLLCYLDTTKILCLVEGEEQWIQIRDITKDTLVKTYLHGYKRVILKNRITLINSPNETIHKLYKLSKNKNQDLIEDLYTSGQHSILVDKLTDIQREKSLTKWSRILQIDSKELLMAWVNNDFEPVIDNNEYHLSQIVLESDDPKTQYGVWANGILSETMSKYTFKNKKCINVFD